MINSDCSTLSASVADDAQSNRLTALGCEHEVVADGQMKDVGQRRLIGNRRHGAIVEATIEQPPGIGAFLIGGGQRLANVNRPSLRNDASGATRRGFFG